MCGRFAQVFKHDQLVKLTKELKIQESSDQIELNYNLAPTQTLAAIVSKASQEENIRYWGFFRWGLIPSWAKEIGNYNLINIRSESVMEKPSFKSGLVRRRCLIPANGFYEWRQSDKQAYFIHSQIDELILMAGIYDAWTSPDGSLIPSASILTTASQEPISGIHSRMPVILEPSELDFWLDSTQQEPKILHEFVSQPRSNSLTLRPISPYVNKIRNNGTQCWQASTTQDEIDL